MFKILTLNFNNITTGTGLLNHRPSLVRRQCLLFALYLQLQKVCYNNVSKGGGIHTLFGYLSAFLSTVGWGGSDEPFSQGSF